MKLLSLQVEAEQWELALAAAKNVEAIDPLQSAAIRQTLTAATALKNSEVSIQMLRALLELEPGDSARTHFMLAKIFSKDNVETARRHVLLSLEKAPRYREAHKLLLKISAVTGEPPETTNKRLAR